MGGVLMDCPPELVVLSAPTTSQKLELRAA